MLQQTRVDTVVPYFKRFLSELPTLKSLAEASEERVLALWSGLGYYRRARQLHAAAKQVVRDHGGTLPREVDELTALEGIGRYTAGAVASIAFGRSAAVVDGNVTRVLCRLFAIEEDVTKAIGRARVWRVAEWLAAEPGGHPGDWNQALMELGATVCIPRQPRCEGCPAKRFCGAARAGTAASLPRKSPKRRQTVLRRSAIVLASAKRVLLARRRPDQLFGGLWEPPHAADARVLALRLKVDIGDLHRVGEVVHVLSHRTLRIDVLRGPLPAQARFSVPGPEYDAVRTPPIAELQNLAHATLARKILEVANALPYGVRSAMPT
jgi:A/G-specific adenine glycosylase